SYHLVAGVSYLHRNRIAHLDIKPGNVVCSQEGILKIIDFSVSVYLSGDEQIVRGYQGTQNWTAPEVGTEEGPSREYNPFLADKWSCGAMM
ncbi:hypothetical protein GYMLUDRAFT_102093, partial [Collybiopsis luxurians FD-317 M1]